MWAGPAHRQFRTPTSDGNKLFSAFVHSEHSLFWERREKEKLAFNPDKSDSSVSSDQT